MASSHKVVIDLDLSSFIESLRVVAEAFTAAAEVLEAHYPVDASCSGEVVGGDDDASA